MWCGGLGWQQLEARTAKRRNDLTLHIGPDCHCGPRKLLGWKPGVVWFCEGRNWKDCLPTPRRSSVTTTTAGQVPPSGALPASSKAPNIVVHEFACGRQQPSVSRPSLARRFLAVPPRAPLGRFAPRPLHAPDRRQNGHNLRGAAPGSVRKLSPPPPLILRPNNAASRPAAARLE